MKYSQCPLAIVVGLIVLLMGSTIAHAEERFYVAGFGGLTVLSDSEISNSGGAEFDFETGWNLGGALGYQMGNLRGELELAYRENDIESLSGSGSINGVDISTVSYLFNVYLDFKNSSVFTPYVGAGIGGAHIEFNDDFGPDDDDTVFAYKVAGGAAMEMAENFDFFLDYSYLGTTDPEFFNAFDMEYDSHSLSAGFRLKF